MKIKASTKIHYNLTHIINTYFKEKNRDIKTVSAELSIVSLNSLIFHIKKKNLETQNLNEMKFKNLMSEN